jgi:hypothetical protein
MTQFINAPYKKVDSYQNVYANNLKVVQGQYRLWRYVYDYEVEEPKLEPVPLKLKSKKGLPLFRYVSASNFLSDLNASQLSFISPKLWNDPFEQQFYREEGISINGKTYYIRCICLTYDWIESEEAAWNRSADIQDTIRVEFDFDNLCSILGNAADYNFFFSVVDYSLPRKDIVKLAKELKRGTKIPASLDEYLNMLSLKRKAFSFENELRIFMVGENPFNDDIVHIKYPVQPINSVCLPPQKGSELLSCVEKAVIDRQTKVLKSKLYDID